MPQNFKRAFRMYTVYKFWLFVKLKFQGSPSFFLTNFGLLFNGLKRG